MNEVVFHINGVSVYGFGLLSVVAFMWGSFVYYRKAIESRLEEKIVLDSIVLSAFWGVIVGRLVYSLVNVGVFWNHWSRLLLFTNYPGIDRFGVFIGVGIGLWLCLRKVKGKFFDWIDLMMIGAVAGLSIYFAGLGLLVFQWQLILFGFGYLLSFFYLWSVEKKYRNFSWYRNGKTSAHSGFVFGVSVSLLGFWYLIEKLMTTGLHWQELTMVTVLFVGGLVLVYIRSGRSLAEDRKKIFRYGKK